MRSSSCCILAMAPDRADKYHSQNNRFKLATSRMKIRLFNLAEWCLAILLSLAVLFLLVVRARHACALWRAECASLQVAVITTLHDLLQNVQRASSPASF